MRNYQFDYNDRIVCAQGDTEGQAASTWFLNQPLAEHLFAGPLVLFSTLCPGRYYTCSLPDCRALVNCQDDDGPVEDAFPERGTLEFTEFLLGLGRVDPDLVVCE